jgi:dihydropyrimidinase
MTRSRIGKTQPDIRMDTVICNAMILDESGAFEGTIGIRNGRIAAVLGRDAEVGATEVIDAAGNLVLPGIIDAHVHLELPVSGTVSSDDFETGSVAAAFGGVTTIIDFATQAEGGSLVEAIEQRRAVAEEKVAVDYSLHCAITDWSEKTRREMAKVVGYGVTSFKLFMIYEDRGWMADDGVLFECFREAARHDAVAGVHAENPHIIAAFTKKALASRRKGTILHALSRPNFSEAEAVQRAIYLASISDAKIYIFHMTTEESCGIVEEWQRQGYPVAAETCPQFLVLSSAVYRRRNGHYFATCPPLRTEKDSDYLWGALESGSVQVVSTDHCTFTKKQKDRWRGDFRKIPFGMPGVETLLPIMFTHGLLAGRISAATLVQTLCANPAKIFGLYPRKGAIRIGSDADLIVIDPEREIRISPKKLHMNSDFSPYAGFKLRGFPSITMLRGKIIQKDGRFVGHKGDGVFLKRS